MLVRHELRPWHRMAVTATSVHSTHISSRNLRPLCARDFPPPDAPHFQLFFGDIAAGCELICGMYRALDGARGSASDHQALKDELDAFSHILGYIVAALSSMTLQEGIHVDLEKEVRACHHLLASFNEWMSSYRKTLGSVDLVDGGEPLHSFAGSCFAREVAEFRDRLSAHRATSGNYLTISVLVVELPIDVAAQGMPSIILETSRCLSLTLFSDGTTMMVNDRTRIHSLH